MSTFIPLSIPNLSGNEKRYVNDALDGNWVSTAGSYVNDFEKSLAEYVGTPKAVACQSGTAGLHVALRLCGVEPGDEVIVPTLTFIAAVNPVRYLYAEPVFMDCDGSLCMDPHKLEEFCEKECDFSEGVLIDRQSGARIRAVVVVHVFGNMADMIEIMDIAKRYNLKVIEDATEALGTHYTTGPFEGYFAGTIGDIGVYSFNGNKIMTTGGGGMIVSRNEEHLSQAVHLTTQAKLDEVRYTHDDIGYNYRMTNIQAAIGLAQLEQLEDFIETKRANFELYNELIESVEGLSFVPFREGTRPNRWFYALLCEDSFPCTRDELMDGLQARSIQSRPVWGLIHEQAPYAGSHVYRIDQAPEFQRAILNVPCSTSLTVQDVQRVVDAIDACAKKR